MPGDKIDYIVFHGNCPDGIAAREIVKLVHPTAKCIPFVYDPEFTVLDNMLWVDGCPKGLELQEAVLKRGGIIQDHHTSNLDTLRELDKKYPGQVWIGENGNTPPESGAVLAFRYFQKWYEGAQIPGFLDDLEAFAITVGVSDTFRTDLPQFEIGRALGSVIIRYGNDFCYTDWTWAKLQKEAQMMMEINKRQSQAMAQRAIFREMMDGTKVAFLNSSHISDSAKLLYDSGKADIVVGVKLGGGNNESIYFSVRCTVEAAIKSLPIAKACGGGGHAQAHGFSIPYQGEDLIKEYTSLYHRVVMGQ